MSILSHHCVECTDAERELTRPLLERHADYEATESGIVILGTGTPIELPDRRTGQRKRAKCNHRVDDVAPLSWRATSGPSLSYSRSCATA